MIDTVTRACACMCVYACVWAWLVRKESVCLFDNDESKRQLFMLSMDTDVKLDVRDLYVFLGPCLEANRSLLTRLMVILVMTGKHHHPTFL